IGVGVVNQLLAEKEEGLVVAVVDFWQIHRPAERKSSLVMPHGAADLLEERSRVQGVVVEEIVCAAVKLIRSGADGDVGEPASCPAVLGVERVRDHAKLTNLFHRRTVLLNAPAHIALACRSSVHEYLGVARAGAIHARAPGGGRGYSRQKREVGCDVAL